jgi:hypothetical protein
MSDAARQWFRPASLSSALRKGPFLRRPGLARYVSSSDAVARLEDEQAMNEERTPEQAAFEAGRDCAINGPNTRNCHYLHFATPEMTIAWERG